MKITKVSFFSANTVSVELALQSAFSPFGSLTEGVDGNALANAMTRWVDAKSGERQKGLANELIGLVWSAQTDQLSTVEVGIWKVCLCTPTSGTQIRLSRSAGSYNVEVDFGPGGSEGRAWAILAHAEMSNIPFVVYSHEGEVDRRVVVTTLWESAEEGVDWLLRPETKRQYSPEGHAEMLERANRRLACMEQSMQRSGYWDEE